MCVCVCVCVYCFMDAKREVGNGKRQVPASRFSSRTACVVSLVANLGKNVF